MPRDACASSASSAGVPATGASPASQRTAAGDPAGAGVKPLPPESEHDPCGAGAAEVTEGLGRVRDRVERKEAAVRNRVRGMSASGARGAFGVVRAAQPVLAEAWSDPRIRRALEQFASSGRELIDELRRGHGGRMVRRVVRGGSLPDELRAGAEALRVVAARVAEAREARRRRSRARTVLLIAVGAAAAGAGAWVARRRVRPDRRGATWDGHAGSGPASSSASPSTTTALGGRGTA